MARHVEAMDLFRERDGEASGSGMVFGSQSASGRVESEFEMSLHNAKRSVHGPGRWRLFLVPGMAGLIGLSATLMAFHFARLAELGRMRLLFEQNVSVSMQNLMGKVDRYEGMLFTLRTLFNFSNHVTEQEFAGAAGQLLRSYPEVIALEWVPRVAANGRQQIDQEIRRVSGRSEVGLYDRSPGGLTVAAAERAEHWPILYAEPLKANEIAIGFDLIDGPTVEQLTKARDSAETALTPRKTLVQIKEPLIGLIAILPVYSTAEIPATIEDRRRLHRGFLQAVFNLPKLMTEASRDAPLEGLNFSVLDDNAPPDSKLLHRVDCPPSREGIVSRLARMSLGRFVLAPSVDVGGRNWVFRFEASPGWIDRRRSSFPLLMLLTGAMLTGLGVLVLWRNGLEHERIEAEVGARTAELTGVNNRLGVEIQERKVTESQLMQANSMLLAAQRLGRIGSWERDFKSNSLQWSDEVYRIFGRNKAEFRPDLQAFLESVHPEDRARLKKASEEAMANRAPYDMDYRILRPDGTVRHVVIHAEPVLGEDGEPRRFQGAIQDITTRKLAEVALIEAKTQLEAAQRLGHIGSWEADLKLGTVIWSAETFRILGMVPGEIKPTVESFYALVHPDDIKRVREETERAILERRFSIIQHRILLADGKVRWVIGRCEIERDEAGRPLRALGTIQDVTDQKEAEIEREKLARNLLETQKLESLGLLAGGIAHDFNNLLTGVLGSANLARVDLPRGHAAHEFLEHIENAAVRAAELCGQMLAYAGRSKPAVRRLVISELVRESASLLQVSLSGRARLMYELDPRTPVIQGDPVQLRQIVMNLILNAAEAMPPQGGVITLATSLVELDPTTVCDGHLLTELAAGKHARIEVRDTGSGMTPEVLERIFDPFFTTKFAGRGLGLAAVSGIIRGHQGAIRVRSTPGAGTVFTIYLPAQPPGETIAPVVSDLEDTWTGSGRTLVIDDEETVRSVAVKILEKLGFTVDQASDGESGIKRFAEAPREYVLVLLDLTMPGMDGERTLAAIRQIRPDIRVIMMSGHAEEVVSGRFTVNAPSAFIQKPFSFSAARRKLRQVLSG